jgi:hypothetical protein
MKTILKVIVFILALCALLGLVLNFSQKFECDLESLILQDNMMPPNWERLWGILPPALPKEGAQDALGVVYEKQNEMASHTIYRYKNGVLAFMFIRINNQLYFPSGQWLWSDLNGDKDWGLSGDEYRIKCGESNDSLLGYLCVAVVRYGSYISEFSSPVEVDIMSETEFKAIVLAIDKQILSCIQGIDDQPQQ